MAPRPIKQEDLVQEKQELIVRREYLLSLKLLKGSKEFEDRKTEYSQIRSRLHRINTYLDPVRHEEQKQKDRTFKMNAKPNMVSHHSCQ